MFIGLGGKPKDLREALRQARLWWFQACGLGLVLVLSLVQLERAGRLSQGPTEDLAYVGPRCIGAGVLFLIAALAARTMLLRVPRIARILHVKGKPAALDALSFSHSFPALLTMCAALPGMLLGFVGSPWMGYGYTGLVIALVLVQFPREGPFADIFTAAEQERNRMGLDAEAAQRTSDR